MQPGAHGKYGQILKRIPSNVSLPVPFDSRSLVSVISNNSTVSLLPHRSVSHTLFLSPETVQTLSCLLACRRFWRFLYKYIFLAHPIPQPVKQLLPISSESRQLYRAASLYVSNNDGRVIIYQQ